MDEPLTMHQQNLELENLRNDAQKALEVRRAKLEAIRLAKETLIENARSKPVDQRDVSAEAIKTFADSLSNYINS